ncbi:TPA: BREX-1 system adenine-specific DNA-methyltransferase PglX, partial [Escherichia coli]
IFTRNVRLNVLSLQESNHLDLPTLWKALNLSGSWQSGTSQGLFSDDDQDLSSFNADNRYQLLKRTLARFTQAKTFGSLIDVPSDDHEQLKEILSTLVELQESGDSMQKPAAKQLIEFVHQALVLSIRYDAVIANPPYMGSKYQTAEVKMFLKDNFKGYEKDLFSAYIVRNLQLAKEHGQLGFMTPFVWMFISSYEQLRSTLIDDEIISTLIQLEYSGFDGATVPICTFTLTKGHIPEYIGSYIRLSDFKGAANQAPKTLQAIKNPECGWFYKAKSDDFKKIPGSPIAYWVSEIILQAFENGVSLKTIGDTRQGMATSDNNRFLRLWFEVNFHSVFLGALTREEAKDSNKKWFPYNKGGDYRKWYGNSEYVVNWEFDGKELLEYASSLYGSPTRTIKSISEYFKPNISWSKISSGNLAMRYYPNGYLFDVAGCCIFSDSQSDLMFLLGFSNTNMVRSLLESISPTLNFEAGQIASLPILNMEKSKVIENTKKLIEIAKNDWDMAETSWGFKRLDIVSASQYKDKIKESYSYIFEEWVRATEVVQELEQENNQIFSKAYGVEDEVDSTVPYNEISINCNPFFRYGTSLTDNERNLRLQSDTITELVSYAVGCFMGRYSLDREGLVYAHLGNEGFAQLVVDGAYSTFRADEDGIIPLTDQEWFKDDATNRFREFVQVVWGEEHLQENLDFVAESLCLNAIKPKKSESALETIRRYLSTQFYKDHLKTYKKRPIYWLFSSGKQKAFECLVYLHRYNEGTLSRMRTEYVTPLLGKYDAYAEQLEKQIETADSTSEANRFKKELDALIKKQVELREFDDKLKHYADMRISLDLDDGVKVNYGKFGDLLADVKAITGSAPEVN